MELYLVFLACIGDFFVTFLLGSLYKEYNFIEQPQSFLGTSDSPVALYMNIWGVLLGVLLIIFAFGLKEAFPQKTKWSVMAFWMVILYALGEGLGSGIFPYNHNGAVLTFSVKLHSVFGGIGMTALIFLPLVVTRIYT